MLIRVGCFDRHLYGHVRRFIVRILTFISFSSSYHLSSIENRSDCFEPYHILIRVETLLSLKVDDNSSQELIQFSEMVGACGLKCEIVAIIPFGLD